MKKLYLLTNEEVKFIKSAMIHSANVHRLFCEQEAKEYPLEETNKLINETNRIITEVFENEK